MLLQMAEERPIAVPAPPRPRRPPTPPWRGGGGHRGRPEPASQGGRTGAPPPTGPTPGPGLPPAGEAAGGQAWAAPRRPARPGSRNRGPPCRDHLAGASRMVTDKWAHPALATPVGGPPRQSGQAPRRAAVAAWSLHGPAWASHTGLRRGHGSRARWGRVIHGPGLQGQGCPSGEEAGKDSAHWGWNESGSLLRQGHRQATGARDVSACGAVGHPRSGARM